MPHAGSSQGAALSRRAAAAEAGGVEEEAQAPGDAQSMLAAAGEAERDHAAEGAHLAAGDLVPGMAGQPRVVRRCAAPAAAPSPPAPGKPGPAGERHGLPTAGEGPALRLPTKRPARP